MAGRGSTTLEQPITPGRKLHITYDPDDQQLVNRGFGLIRTAADIAASGARMNGCVMVPGAGIRLDEDFASTRVAYSGTDSDLGVYLRPADAAPGAPTATIATKFAYRHVFRTHPEVPGSGTGSPLPTVAGKFYKKRAAAGDLLDSASFRLAADQTAFPGPTLSDSETQMDRVMVSVDNHNQDVDLAATFVNWGDTGQKGMCVGILYLNGPAGVTEDFRGYGQYAAAVFNGGVLELYERGIPLLPTVGGVTWNQRTVMRFPAPQGWTVNQQYHLIVNIVPESGMMVFRLLEWEAQVSGAPGAMLGAALSSYAAHAIQLQTKNVYRVPKIEGAPQSTIEDKVRVDLPRPFFNQFQVKQVLLKATGEIEDLLFAIVQGDFFPVWDGAALSGHTMRVEWYYDAPNAATEVDLSVRPYNSATALTPARSGLIGPGSARAGEYHEYDFADDYSGAQAFAATFELTGDTVRTPTLVEMRVLKQPRFEDRTGDNVTGAEIVGFSTVGAGSDPTAESAGWKVIDRSRVLDRLQYNGALHNIVDTEVDGDPDVRVKLHMGYIELCTATRRRKLSKHGRGMIGQDPPKPIGYDYDVKSLGMWERINEARDTTLFSFVQDPNAAVGVPYRVTDILITLLRRCGFDDDRIKIARSEIRLFPVLQGLSDPYVVKPLSDLGQALSYYARDYLGAGLVYDPNYGDRGAWILIYPPSGPYTNVAYFTTAGPASAMTPFSLAAYPDVNIAAGSYQGVEHLDSTAKQIPVIDLRMDVKRPLANRLQVSGVGYLLNFPIAAIVKRYINVNSYKYRGDAPAAPSADNPDWLGREVPFWYIDPMLQTQEAVELVAFQLYRTLCLGYKLFRVYAPLQFIDRSYLEDPDNSSSTVTVKKSPLRFGDPAALYDGEATYQCVVRSVSIDIQNDTRQMAVYELQQVRS